MTKYVSTRDCSAEADGATAVLNGFAPDGGLYVPQSLPVLNYADLLDIDYAARADKVLRAFFDFDVKGIAQEVYSHTDDPAPTVKIDDNAFVLELWHGDTYSAKDMAFAVLARLIERAKSAKGESSDTLIPLATSGDMGKSAAEAFRSANAQLCVFYPSNGMDELTRRELLSTASDNLCAVGVNADFDDIQSAIKAAFADSGLNAALGENNIKLSSANSVNIGLIVPQIVHYFSAYCDLVNSGEIASGSKVDFVLPTGNFGSMIAGYYALKMGLPINRLVLAAVHNTALSDFISSGVYDINRIIGRPSAPVLGNLERLIFGTSGNNAELTAARMSELQQSGRFSVTEDEINAVRDIFASDSAGDEIPDEIDYLFEEYGYLADTRTAAAFVVADRREFVRPTVVLSIASPYRSATAVMKAIGEKVSTCDEQLLRRMEDVTALDAPTELLKVFSAKQVHHTVIEPQDISDFIRQRYIEKV